MDRKSAAGSVDAYIERFPQDTQALLKKMRTTIRKAAPQAEEKISYGIPTFALNGNLVHFAAFRQHIGFFPGADGIAAFRKDISAYKWAKGSVQFPFGKPLPLPLVSRITRFRVKQNLAKATKKGASKARKKTAKNEVIRPAPVRTRPPGWG